MESIPLAEQKTHEVLFRDWNINPPICMTYLLYWHTLQTIEEHLLIALSCCFDALGLFPRVSTLLAQAHFQSIDDYI